ncbi:Zinc finger FYVE domain-containing protein 16 [Balamuthia mandrillaris]
MVVGWDIYHFCKRGLLFGAATGAVVGTAVGTAAGLAAFGVGSIPGGIGGAAVGAVVGTVVAGSVGVTSGRVIQYKLNRQLDKEVLTQVYGKEWVPDSETVCCMRCGAKFTKTRRRHHCRRCGQVLCKKCCHRKEELFARGMERPIKQRVCVDCESRT